MPPFEWSGKDKPAQATGTGTGACYGGLGATCFTAEQTTTGSCTGCGPRTGGDPTTRAGARILAPLSPGTAGYVSTLEGFVDNLCPGAPPQEVGPAFGNTPINGALRDMFRYYQTGWTEPDGAPTFATPLTASDPACRRVNVIPSVPRRPWSSVAPPTPNPTPPRSTPAPAT